MSSPAEPLELSAFMEAIYLEHRVKVVERVKTYLANAKKTGKPLGLYCLDMRGTDCTGIDFSGVRLLYVDLGGANLTDANFTGADLTGGRLEGAICHRTIFDHAVLQGVDVSSIDDVESSFEGAFFGEIGCEY